MTVLVHQRVAIVVEPVTAVQAAQIAEEPLVVAPSEPDGRAIPHLAGRILHPPLWVFVYAPITVIIQPVAARLLIRAGGAGNARAAAIYAGLIAVGAAVLAGGGDAGVAETFVPTGAVSVSSASGAENAGGERRIASLNTALRATPVLAVEAVLEADVAVDAEVWVVALGARVPSAFDAELSRATVAVEAAATSPLGPIDAHGVCSLAGPELPSAAFADALDDALVIESTGEGLHLIVCAGCVVVEADPELPPKAIHTQSGRGAVERGDTGDVVHSPRLALPGVVAWAQIEPAAQSADPLAVAVHEVIVVSACLDLLSVVYTLRLLAARRKVAPLTLNTVR